ncbi:hypothetical protein FHETE_1310 [Fusarium heterosporum]|uniref:Uncharacterized protein n=1 Tax=Fusarium heterosporum TaxID=42747 RepID=A0A8H5TY19_FUSHE|nr:hypothetical protein FHETE_1310 [Fusarium heterosporum]
MVDIKYRHTQRSKSLPITQSPKKSFFSIFSRRRLSLSSKRQPNAIRLYDESDNDDTAQVIPQEIQPRTPSRFSRRASRFWSASSANQFDDDSSQESSTYPAYGGAAYVPRHAASDFSRTTTSRLTMMAEGDEATLCSFNCRASRIARSYSTDDEPDVDHRERALNALTTRRSSALLSEGSNESANDYSLFLANAVTVADIRRRRSAAAWAELEHRAAVANRRASGTDPLVGRPGRQSTYLGVPGSTYESSRPVSSVAASINDYIRPVQVTRAW